MERSGSRARAQAACASSRDGAREFMSQYRKRSDAGQNLANRGSAQPYGATGAGPCAGPSARPSGSRTVAVFGVASCASSAAYSRFPWSACCLSAARPSRSSISMKDPDRSTAPRTIVIPKGEGRIAIAERLEKEGIITNRWTFVGGHLLQAFFGAPRKAASSRPASMRSRNTPRCAT